MPTSPFYNQTFRDPLTDTPAVGGRLHIYAAGSDTHAPIWLDAALSIPAPNPLTPFNAAGQVQQYFVPGGVALDYKAYTSDGREICTDLNVTAGDGSGGGAEDHKVAADAADSAPDYLIGKLASDGSIDWSLVTPGGIHKVQGAIDQSWLSTWLAEQGYTTGASSDHKVLGDGISGDVAGYLIAKLVDAAGNPFLVNGSHQLILPFARLDGAAFTGAVSVAGQLSSTGDTALATGPGATIHLVGPATIEQAIANILKLPGITPGQWLMLNGAGQVVGVAAPSSDHKVAYDVSDAIPGFLGVKAVAGSGIQINVTNDGTNGKVMHLNVQPGYFARTLYKSIKPATNLVDATPVTLLPGVVPAIPKNTLAVGDVIRIKVMNSVTSGGGIIGIAVYSNGVQLYGGTGFSSGFNGFSMEYTITVNSIGPSGVVDMNGVGYSAAGQFSFGNYTASIDTTVDNILDVQSNTDIGVTLTNTICTIERL